MTQIPSPEFSIIIPTLNEADNISMIVDKVKSALKGIDWEIIFVDDNSNDGTVSKVRELASDDARIRGLRRIGRHGLSSACIEGILSSSAPYIAVMDADLQHDVNLLPKMFEQLSQADYELVVASRYIDDHSVEGWSFMRRTMSRIATSLGEFILPIHLTDPMSGFFALQRSLVESNIERLSGIGFKILFDICAFVKPSTKYIELPYVFGTRQFGESKMSSQVAWDYLLTIGHKLFGRFFPVKFLSFSLVGTVGAIIHMGVLYISLRYAFEFASAQVIAVSVAMVSNFWMNNNLTFRDVRLKGKQLIKGLGSFIIACGLGALINISLAIYLYETYDLQWYIAATGGIIVGAVWNYATNSFYTWRQ